MRLLRRILDRVEATFSENGKLKALYPVYEALDTFLYTTGRRTSGAPHVRDAMDLKRLMVAVVVALTPCVAMALWNTGHQANTVLQTMGVDSVPGWRGEVLAAFGLRTAAGFWADVFHGALYFLPVYVVTMIVGGVWEALFAIVRRHELSEGFLVTGLLIPLTMPPNIPLWQVALGTSFGVVIGKELFGGVGRNILNPALTARAFVFFAYPQQMSGDNVWTAVDGYTHATPLGAMAIADPGGGTEIFDLTWTQAFLGAMPGSMGETSTLACLFGAMVLVLTGVGSWRIMVSMLIGAVVAAAGFVAVGSDSNAMFGMPVHWHLVTGGFAFGLVFMATDPVSAAQTDLGRWVYGLLIGCVAIIIRVVNPAYPEGVMLAILLGNVFAPLIDYFVMQANIRRRSARYG